MQPAVKMSRKEELEIMNNINNNNSNNNNEDDLKKKKKKKFLLETWKLKKVFGLYKCII